VLEIYKIEKNHIHFKSGKEKVYFGGIEKEEICKYLGYIPKIILEFGSFDGGDGLKYKTDFPDSTVVSIEACPDCFSDLEYLKSFGVNILNYCVTDFNGEIDFYQSFSKNKNHRASVGSQLVSTPEIKKINSHLVYESSVIKVPAITLEKICKDVLKNNNIDYIHVDTQGTFLHVMRGLGGIRPKLILGEVDMSNNYLGGDELKETDVYMEDLGYEKIYTEGKNTLYRFIKNKN
jgi:FkbM family methyltransferase